ncbi:hypothetical protein [Bifidobacterium favimelis]|uniref:Uncharacterized protein n=1 Tax=Bifidobacterium favimelis TaxID=3122979 RepID=A0ABU8ZP24_9BIFI
MVIERVMFWAIVVLCVLVVVMIPFAVLVRTRDSDPQKGEDGKHFGTYLVDWVKNASTCVKVGRVVFLATTLFAFVDLVIILCCTLISAYQSHPSWFTGVLNVVSVLLGAIECIMLFVLRGKASNDYFLWIYAWFLMLTIVLSVAASCTYFDGKAGLAGADSLMAGALILLTAVITSVNLLLYIHDLWKSAGVECLRWFKRTLIFEVITVVFVVAVIFAPLLERYAEFPMALEVFFTIATWEYLKHIWDERIMPAQQ